MSPARISTLTRAECLDRLKTKSLGRIGLSVAALPVVLPVNFILRGDNIIIRTISGTKLDAAARGAVVAFEVDELDEASGSAWSVLVQGHAAEIVDSAVIPGEDDPVLDEWAPLLPATHLVSIELANVSGRLLMRVP